LMRVKALSKRGGGLVVIDLLVRSA